VVTSTGGEPPVEPPSAAEHDFDFTGGRLCLDFANTVGSRGRASLTDYLRGYGDLLAWVRQAEAIDRSTLERLTREAAARPSEAAAALGRLKEIRELLYRVLAAAGRGEQSSAAEIEQLNLALGAALAHARLVPSGPGFAWGWEVSEADFEAPIRPVLHDLAELLTGEDLSLLRVCAWDPCAWLFVDTTRNRSRQWCDMKTCGNRAKARRHYERRKKAGSMDVGASRE
jgi:predicted RNA-binding Zn ribbon-like protein